jgi:nitrogen fixation protein NifU and related proteins
MNATANYDELQELYRETILDHARQPRNFRRLANATHTAEGINPLCGDKLRLYLIVDANETVIEAGFEGSGCAISIASASLLTETISNLSVAEADACFASVTGRLTQHAIDDEIPTNIDLTKLKAFDGVRKYPSRVKCATLAWHALHAALNHSQTSATTE